MRRRQGYTQLVPLKGAHSLWSPPGATFALVADANTLYCLQPNGLLSTAATGLSGADVHYVDTPVGVYWSDGQSAGKVLPDGTGAPWGVPTPQATFTVVPAAVGGLDAGTYGVTLTFLNAAGEESGAPATVFVDVPAGGGVTVGQVPILPGASEAAIYITGANSTLPFYAASVGPGTQSYLIGAGWRGRALATQFCTQLPPLRYPALKSGRLFGFVGSTLVWSEPLRYGMTNAANDFIRLSGETPTMLVFPDSTKFIGYIGTKRCTYVLKGEDVDHSALAIASHQGVIPGSLAIISPASLNMEFVHTPVPVWIDTAGVPYGATSFFGLMPMHDKFVYPIYDQAAAFYARVQGEERYLVGGRGGAPSGLAASDYVIANVYNNGGGT